MIFIDTNILIDVFAPDQAWKIWSGLKLEELNSSGGYVINTIVVAELATNFPSLAALTGSLQKIGIRIDPLEADVAFAAGEAFRAYRRRHGKRDAILSDFLIGAHALRLRATLLTRDAGIYRTYFPGLTLITPEDEHD
ncbi:type II toxin-antitoxin system VapC family toxin [Sphingomonas arantia]|uniref:Type II toxin-antitoxin system VapC family toxin n=1 Tax=Sphingomonas arantia TaxID=1460676 RepID=A0ABW4TVU7_9SPHN